jgi:hypothetical protein
MKVHYVHSLLRRAPLIKLISELTWSVGWGVRPRNRFSEVCLVLGGAVSDWQKEHFIRYHTRTYIYDLYLLPFWVKRCGSSLRLVSLPPSLDSPSSATAFLGLFRCQRLRK